MKAAKGGMNKELNSTPENKDENNNQVSKKKKVLMFIVKILRWPLFILGVPVLSIVLPYIFSGEETFFAATTNDTVFYAMLIALAIGIIAIGFIGSLIRQNFLSTTGIAAIVYFIAAFFLKEDSWPVEDMEFKNLKLIVVLILVTLVFLGDLLGTVFRKIKDKIDFKRS